MLSCLQDKFTGYGRHACARFGSAQCYIVPSSQLWSKDKKRLYMTAIDRSEDGLSILQTFKGTFGCGFFNIT